MTHLETFGRVLDDAIGAVVIKAQGKLFVFDLLPVKVGWPLPFPAAFGGGACGGCVGGAGKSRGAEKVDQRRARLQRRDDGRV